jgi:hypothetical protein
MVEEIKRFSKKYPLKWLDEPLLSDTLYLVGLKPK